MALEAMKTGGKRRCLLILSFVLCGVFICTACATSPYISPLSQVPEAKRLEVEQALESYNSEDLREVLEPDAEQQMFIKRFMSYIPEEKRHLLQHDPALDFLAHTHAYYRLVAGKRPHMSLVHWNLWRLGIPEYWYWTNWAWVSGRSSSTRLDAKMEKFAKRLDLEGEPIRFGLARFDYAMHKYVIGMMFIHKYIETSEIPKHYEPGEKLKIDGRITVPLKNIKFYLQLEGKKVRKCTIKPAEDGSFRIRTSLPKEPGRYFAHIQGVITKDDSEEEGGKGRHFTKLFWLPLYVGVEEEKTVPQEILEVSPNPKYRSIWRKMLLEHYNAQRAEYDLPPLILCEQATEIANEHAQSVVDKTRKNRMNKDFKEKMSERGFQVESSLRLNSIFKKVSSLIQMLDWTPSHRKCVLSEKYRWLALGIARYRPGRYQLVEYFIKPEDGKDETKPALEAANPPVEDIVKEEKAEMPATETEVVREHGSRLPPS